MQLYLQFPDSAGEPFIQLRGFEKVAMKPGEKATVQFSLSKDRWLSIWNTVSHSYQLVNGNHTVVGPSIGQGCTFILTDGLPHHSLLTVNVLWIVRGSWLVHRAKTFGFVDTWSFNANCANGLKYFVLVLIITPILVIIPPREDPGLPQHAPGRSWSTYFLFHHRRSMM